MTTQLSHSWQRSADIHSRMRDALTDAKLGEDVLTVAVSGSLGRMEVVDASDCDLIVILSDQALDDPRMASQCYDQVANAIQPIGLATSKPGGVFSTPNCHSRICDTTTMGVVDEDMTTFGQRIQLLIDSQPLYGHDEFDRLQQAILARYAHQTIEYDSTKQWTYLLNDLIRYHRSLCVRTQWQTRAEPAKWRLLNLKLAHSRLVNYAGLLLLLGECSSEQHDKPKWMSDRLTLTPLERIVYVLGNHNVNAESIVASYDHFLSNMNDASFLQLLAREPSGELPDDHDAYDRLRQSSRTIHSAVTDFLFTRPSTWDPQFFELLLF